MSGKGQKGAKGGGPDQAELAALLNDAEARLQAQQGMLARRQQEATDAEAAVQQAEADLAQVNLRLEAARTALDAATQAANAAEAQVTEEQERQSQAARELADVTDEADEAERLVTEANQRKDDAVRELPNATAQADRAEAQLAGQRQRVLAARKRKPRGKFGCLVALFKWFLFYPVLVVFAVWGGYRVYVDGVPTKAELKSALHGEFVPRKAESKEGQKQPLVLYSLLTDRTEASFAAFVVAANDAGSGEKPYCSDWRRMQGWFGKSIQGTIPDTVLRTQRKELLSKLDLEERDDGELTPINGSDGQPSKVGEKWLGEVRKYFKAK